MVTIWVFEETSFECAVGLRFQPLRECLIRILPVIYGWKKKQSAEGGRKKKRKQKQSITNADIPLRAKMPGASRCLFWTFIPDTLSWFANKTVLVGWTLIEPGRIGHCPGEPYPLDMLSVAIATFHKNCWIHCFHIGSGIVHEISSDRSYTITHKYDTGFCICMAYCYLWPLNALTLSS